MALITYHQTLITFVPFYPVSNPKKGAFLQPPIFPFCLEARARFHGIQVMMTYNQSVWKDALQFAEQCKQRCFLL